MNPIHIRSAAAAGEARTIAIRAAATASCRIIGGIVTAGSEVLVRDPSRRAVCLEDVGHVIRKFSSTARAILVDDGGAVSTCTGSTPRSPR